MRGMEELQQLILLNIFGDRCSPFAYNQDSAYTNLKVRKYKIKQRRLFFKLLATEAF